MVGGRARAGYVGKLPPRPAAVRPVAHEEACQATDRRKAWRAARVSRASLCGRCTLELECAPAFEPQALLPVRPEAGQDRGGSDHQRRCAETFTSVAQEPDRR